MLNNTENLDKVFEKLKEYEGQFLKIKIKNSSNYFITIKGFFNIFEDKYYNLFHRCNCQDKNYGIYSELVGQGNYGIIKIETQEGCCIYDNPYICNPKLSGVEMITLKFGEEGKKRYDKYFSQEKYNFEKDASFC